MPEIKPFTNLPIKVNRRLLLVEQQKRMSIEPEIIVAENLPNPQEEGLISRALRLAGLKK